MQPLSCPSPAASSTQTRQVPAAPQTDETQSAAALHMLPVGQAGHAEPQSTSVSVPLRMESPQLAAWQMEAWQTSLTQSVAIAHAPPDSHAGHAAPQSTSVSPPLRTPSLHTGALHMPEMHTDESQSRGRLQDASVVHGAQVLPPQSTSVSVPLNTPSEQLASVHRWRATSQRPLVQSAFSRHSTHAPLDAHTPVAHEVPAVTGSFVHAAPRVPGEVHPSSVHSRRSSQSMTELHRGTTQVPASHSAPTTQSVSEPQPVAPASILQVALQPSSVTSLPSSQPSEAPRMPSPQAGIRNGV